MSNGSAQGRYEPPSAKRLALTSVIALLVALLVLVVFILPAEYGIDPTRIGGLLGIDGMSGAPTRTVTLVDNIGGNEALREAEIPDFGQPTPLPNPNVHQAEPGPMKTRTMTVELALDAETEIKAVLQKDQVILYNWSVDDGIIYSDFHGHTPEFGDSFFVRYQEDPDGSSGSSGSLVAPFSGEHGWYWLNLSDHPVTVTLNIAGYFDEMIDYSDQF